MGTGGDPSDELDRQLGRVVGGKYRIQRCIAVGAMGAVFAGRDLRRRAPVAVKVLRPELRDDEEANARFTREARFGMRLDHPNCLSVFDRGTTADGTRWLVMPYLHGNDLRTELRSRTIPLARAVDLAHQLFTGLQHVHAHGIVHRDIKPANLFLARGPGGRDRLEIVDFGIARSTCAPTAGHYRTGVGVVLGTPMYMSPEQIEGKRSDERSDLYSAGLVFYEMLAGTRPFAADDVVRSMREQRSCHLAPLPAWVPPILAAVVQELVSRDRERRVQTAEEALGWIDGATSMVWPGGGLRRALETANARPSPTPGFDRPTPAMRELPEARHLGDALDAFLQMSTGRAADQLADEIAPRTRPSHRPELEDSDTNRTPRIGP